MARQTTFGRRGVLAAAAGAIAGAIVAPDRPPVAATAGGGDQGALILGSNPRYRTEGNNLNSPNVSSVATTVQASPNFSNYTSVSDATVFQVDARPAGNHEINGIEAFATGDGTAVIATADPASTDSTGVEASGGRYGVRAAGVVGVFAAGGGTATPIPGQPAIGVLGVSTAYGGIFFGEVAPIVLGASTATGAPVVGAHFTGELVVDSHGALFYCTAAGQPGTWVNLSAPATSPVLHLLPTPERFIDTRSGLGGVQGPVPGGATKSFQMSARNGESNNTSLQVPDAATALVGNLTALGGPAISVGSYLTLWPGGPQPTVSNINVGPSAVVANSFVVATSITAGHRTISVFNSQQCDYLIDITGYYT